MLADFFSKPFSGKLFRFMRDVVMGHAPISALDLIQNISSPKERVGENKNTAQH